MTERPPANATSRRHFIAGATLGAVATIGGSGLVIGCSKKAKSTGTASNAKQTALVLPKQIPKRFVEPDIPGEGPIPDGYLKYPKELVTAVKKKPGSSGRPITTMNAWWGATPPGPDRNSYLQAVNAELGVPLNPSVQDGNTYAAKLSAILGARDVPDLLSAPNWEVDKIPRFAQAVKALFEDLTEYLSGDAIAAYPMLATLPTPAWQHCVWGGRLAAVPFPNDGAAFPWGLFYRKDLTDKAGVEAPKSIDDLYAFGKKMTNTEKGVWAFGNVFHMVQMFFKCPGQHTGWRKKPGGGLEHKYEMKEYRQALEVTARLFKEGWVHPDIIATNGADSKTLFNGGKMIMTQDGMGVWRGTQGEQSKVTPGFNIQPMPIFSASGGDPIAWTEEKPVFYTFVKKGLGKERVEELLRVLDWCACPFGSAEQQLGRFGVEGKHFTRGPDGSPVPTDLGRKEICGQWEALGGRMPALVATADVPNYVQDSLAYTRATYKYKEPNPFAGLKIEYPANYSKIIQITEDKINDVVRGRRPLGDFEQVVKEWRATGGDEGRAFFEKVLADNGR
jgi:putative aldouronate transport system substrate-binding protein